MTEHEKALWWQCASECLEITIAIALILFFGWMADESFKLVEVCR